MKDGAKQEIEVGSFCIYTGQKTATLSLGCIVGVTRTGVQMMEAYYYKDKPTKKTALRVIQVPDAVAESMNEGFVKKMRKQFPK
jgi:hypothetical protein